MNYKKKIKLIIAVVVVMLGLVCFSAFNSFGIDADTVYKAQGDLNSSVYNTARGYRYTGKDVSGLFQHIEEEDTEEPSDNTNIEDSVYDGETVPTDTIAAQQVNSQNWLQICDSVHKSWGAAGFTYSSDNRNYTTSDGTVDTVRTDCSGYVGYCVHVAGLTDKTIPFSSPNAKGVLSAIGATEVTLDSMQAGDILIWPGAHMEVYAGDNRVYNWGSHTSAQDKYAGITDVSTVDSTVTHSEMHTLASATIMRLPTVSNNTKALTGNKIIFLDAGHGCKYTVKGSNPLGLGFAAVGSNEERDWTPEYTEQLKTALENAGFTIRTLEDYGANRGDYGNSGRGSVYDQSDAELFLQVHWNGSDSASAKGGEFLYEHKDNNTAEVSIANAIYKHYANSSIGVHREPYLYKDGKGSVGLKTSKPVILLEIGFNTNQYDRDIMKDSNKRADTVQAIVDGLIEYYNGGKN